MSDASARGAATAQVPRYGVHTGHNHRVSGENDDHAFTDWWALANARDAIYFVGLPCFGEHANTCQFKRGTQNGRRSSYSISAQWLYKRAKIISVPTRTPGVKYSGHRL